MISRRQALTLGGLTLALASVPALHIDEREVLAALLDRLYEGAGPLPPSQMGAVEAAEEYMRQLPFWTRQQLRGLLRALNLAPIGAWGRPYLRLNATEQAEFLRQLAESDLAVKRLMFHGIKQVGAIAVYSRDSLWEGIGYEGPR